MKITTDDILAKARHLHNFYRQRNTNMKIWRSLALLSKYSLWTDEEGAYIPPEDQEIRVNLPIAYTIVEGYRTLLLSRPPVISVPTSSIKAVHQDQAEEIEKMLYGIWETSNVLEAVKEALWHALAEGWGVLQIVYDADAEERGACPIYAKAVDPLNVYPMPADRPNEWAYVIVIEKRLVGELYQTYVAGHDKRLRTTKIAQQALEGFKDTDEVAVIGYWDDTHFATGIAPFSLLKGEEAETPAEVRWLEEPTEHELGRVPFVFFFGIDLPYRDKGERIGVSVLWPIEGLIRYAARLFSQKATIIARFADPTLVTKTLEGRGFEGVGTYGGQLPLELEEDAYYLQPPTQALSSVDVQIEEILGQIEQAGLPRHVLGQLTVSRLSGVAMNLLRTPVLMKIAFKQMGIENALEKMNEMFLRIIENRVTHPVYIWGTMPDGTPIETVLTPEVIGGYYRNRVRLTASLPTDEPAVTAMLTALVQLGILSKRAARDVIQQTFRDLAPQSLKQEEDQILIETLLEMPAIKNALMWDAAQEAGLPIVEELMGQQGQQPRQGAIFQAGAEAGLPAQTFPFRIAGRQEPTTPDIVRRLAQVTLGAQGGSPNPPPTASPMGPELPTEVEE